MKDRVSLHPNRYKLTPVGGDLYDLTRADEPLEVGTPLSKATLLDDGTAELLGLDPETATPNDAFAQIPFISNHYVWYKKLSEMVYTIHETEEMTNFQMNVNNQPNNEKDFAYTGRSFGTGYVLNKDGTIALTGVFTPSQTPTYNNLSYWETIIPVYMKVDDTLYKITGHQSGGSNFMYYNATQFIVEGNEIIQDYGYANSPNPTAYPPAEDDGYTYEALGRLADGLGKAEVVYGTYTGDGSNSKTFTFDSKPIAITVQRLNYSISYHLRLVMRGATSAGASHTSNASATLTWGDKTVTLTVVSGENSSSYLYNFNQSANTYAYMAILE